MNNQQLCWSCQRACGGKGCPWADKLKPVKGWSAKQRTYKDGYKVVVTYRISACPLYIRDKRTNVKMQCKDGESI